MSRANGCDANTSVNIQEKLETGKKTIVCELVRRETPSKKKKYTHFHQRKTSTQLYPRKSLYFAQRRKELKRFANVFADLG